MFKLVAHLIAGDDHHYQQLWIYTHSPS